MMKITERMFVIKNTIGYFDKKINESKSNIKECELSICKNKELFEEENLKHDCSFMIQQNLEKVFESLREDEDKRIYHHFKKLKNAAKIEVENKVSKLEYIESDIKDYYERIEMFKTLIKKYEEIIGGIKNEQL